MQTNLEKLKDNKFFLFCLFAVGFAVLISNIISEEVANVTTDLLHILASGILLILSGIIAASFKGKGDHGKAFLLFTVFVSFWFTAELIWLSTEFASYLLSFTVEADWLYLTGYPFLFSFSIYYLKPFRGAISRKLFLYTSIITMVFLIPSLYTMYSYNSNANLLEIVWAAIYPIADALVLFPAILGLALFFKGEVGLFWSLACIAITLNIIADSGFFFSYIDQSYYSGNPINILYLWSYILFAFGIHSHVRLHKKSKMKSYDNVDDLK